jgi:hypothetical protein
VGMSLHEPYRPPENRDVERLQHGPRRVHPNMPAKLIDFELSEILMFSSEDIHERLVGKNAINGIPVRSRPRA